MRIPRHLALTAMLVLVASLLPQGVAARPSSRIAPIDGALLERLRAEGRASFFVQMAAQPDLNAAYSIADWNARGHYVYDTLRQLAAETQAPVLAYAERRSLETHPLLASNAVYVRDGDLQAALDLAALPGVASLHLERVLPLSGLRSAQLPQGLDAVTSWGILDTHAPDAWQMGVRGVGLIVAGIDTGVQWDHPALIDRYGCPEDPGNPACWWDPSGICGGVPCDNNGHGTHTMGTMVAKDDPTFPYIAGMAPDATWIACKGCESSGCTEYALTACADWALAPGGDPANRPHVVNNAWGGQGCDDWYMPYVLAWHAAGIFPAFSAGASGPGCCSLGSPGDYMETFASTAHDANRYVGSMAGRGPSCFGTAAKPNVSAPGVNICSTTPDDSWDCWSGTSPATSHSAGAVALVLSACPDYVGNVLDIFALIQDTADEPPEGDCGAPPDGEGNYTYGHGFVNVVTAVEACTDGILHEAGIGTRFRELGDGDYGLSGLVRIRNQEGRPVPGALVEVAWTLPNGAGQFRERLTSTSGIAGFRLRSGQTGTYELCVVNVFKEGYLYNPSQNWDTCKAVLVP